MKRILILGVLLLMAGKVYAGDFKLQKLNLQGDICFSTRYSTIGTGAGLDLATYKDFLKIRVETITFEKEGVGVEAGIGIGVNIKTLLEKIGFKYLPDFGSTVGVLGMLNFNEGKLDAVPYLTVLKIEF